VSAITVRGLHKSYGDLEAVRGVDFDIYEGEVFGLLGPNGAGKTTTVEILEGYRRRTAGEVTVLGHDPQDPGPEFRQRIGVVLQQSELWPNLSVRETHRVFAGYYAHPRDIDEGIVAIGRFPVDQPKAFSVEQDVARDGIVVAGDEPRQTGIVGVAELLKARDVRIKHARRKQTGSPHMREQARDDVRIVDEEWEGRRGLHARKQLSQRPRQRGRPARIAVQRLLRDEVDHRDPRGLIDVMNPRRNPRLRGDTHRGILMRIAQRTRLPLYAQQVAPAANVKAKGRCRRSATRNRRDRVDRGGTEGGSERGVHVFALFGGERVEGMIIHDCFLSHAVPAPRIAEAKLANPPRAH